MDQELRDIKNELKSEDKIKKIICSNCKTVTEYRHKSKPKECQSCGDVYWDKPRDEYNLFHLQDEYLKTRDTEILGKMYLILKLYAKKIIVGMVKNKYFFKVDQLDMKAHDSANKVVYYYLTKPEFRIDSSFGGYLRWPIRNVLYSDKIEEGNDSLNSMIDNENELMDYLPNLSSSLREKMNFSYDIEESLIEKNTYIINILSAVVEEMSIKIDKNYGKKYSLLTLIGIKNRIKKLSDSFMDKYYCYCGIDCQKYIEDSLFFLYTILKDNYISKKLGEKSETIQ
jgi:hypothetical protein